jgi:hypothetical protein
VKIGENGVGRAKIGQNRRKNGENGVKIGVRTQKWRENSQNHAQNSEFCPKTGCKGGETV